MKTEIRRLNQAERSIDDDILLADTVKSGSCNLKSNLIHIRVPAVQSDSGTHSSKDSQIIQVEVNQKQKLPVPVSIKEKSLTPTSTDIFLTRKLSKLLLSFIASSA